MDRSTVAPVFPPLFPPHSRATGPTRLSTINFCSPIGFFVSVRCPGGRVQDEGGWGVDLLYREWQQIHMFHDGGGVGGATPSLSSHFLGNSPITWILDLAQAPK
jgi:hypothetical protein